MNKIQNYDAQQKGDKHFRIFEGIFERFETLKDPMVENPRKDIKPT
jgi:hypothetical protein